jgi:hypothetical protein
MEAGPRLMSDRQRESPERAAEQQSEAQCLRADSTVPDSSGWSRRWLARTPLVLTPVTLDTRVRPPAAGLAQAFQAS